MTDAILVAIVFSLVVAGALIATLQRALAEVERSVKRLRAELGEEVDASVRRSVKSEKRSRRSLAVVHHRLGEIEANLGAVDDDLDALEEKFADVTQNRASRRAFSSKAKSRRRKTKKGSKGPAGAGVEPQCGPSDHPGDVDSAVERA